MFNEAYKAGYSCAFEKIALNALKARQMASSYGIAPEGSWKWALRRSRQGATPQDLGMVPERTRRQMWGLSGKGKTEIGHAWGTDVPNELQGYALGGPSSVDMLGLTPRFQNEANKIGEPAVARAVDELKDGLPGGRKTLSDLWLKARESTRGLNSAHTHTPVSGGHMASVTASKENIEGIIQGLEGAKSTLPHRAGEIEEAINWHRKELASHISAQERISQSSVPDLHPSGWKTTDPWHPTAGDSNTFYTGDVGTHHNIIGPSGVGVHTVRPDKQGGGNRLRSTFFNTPNKVGLLDRLGLAKDSVSQTLKGKKAFRSGV